MPVREAVNVLLVDGDPQSEPFQSETDYLAQALSPEEKSAGSPSQVKVTVVNESQIGARDLTPFDAVVLANVAQFTGAEVSSLDAYLKQGGGVVIFGGDQVVVENYNSILFDSGKGILPAEIVGGVGDAKANQGSVDFDARDYKHPIVGLYQARPPNTQASPMLK